MKERWVPMVILRIIRSGGSSAEVRWLEIHSQRFCSPGGLSGINHGIMWSLQGGPTTTYKWGYNSYQYSYFVFWPSRRHTEISGRREVPGEVAAYSCSGGAREQCAASHDTQSTGGYYTVAECQFCPTPSAANLEGIFLVAVELVILTGQCYFVRGAHATCATGSPRFHHVLWPTTCGAAGCIHCSNGCGPCQPQKCW